MIVVIAENFRLHLIQKARYMFLVGGGAEHLRRRIVGEKIDVGLMLRVQLLEPGDNPAQNRKISGGGLIFNMVGKKRRVRPVVGGNRRQKRVNELRLPDAFAQAGVLYGHA